MRGLNKAMLIGVVGRNIEFKQFDNGGSLATTSIATNEYWLDKKTGERKEATDWHNLVFSNKSAELARDLITKGQQIYVEGKIKPRKWTDAEGKERITVEIKVEDFNILSKKEYGSSQNQNSESNDSKQDEQHFDSDPHDKLPY